MTIDRLWFVVGVKVVWLSAGVSSFVAGYLAEAVDEWIYIDIEDQHPDSMRFIRDCEKVIGKPVTILRSLYYRDVESVCLGVRYINGPTGAPCTRALKKQVRKRWELDHMGDDLTYVWGMDCDEEHRAERIRESFPQVKHEFPLIDRKLSKSDAHGICRQLGIRRPAMYDLGYNNNNCVGCVKGGAGYWNRIRKDFPDVFAARAKMEREIGHSILGDCFLDELPEDKGRMSKEIMEECSILCQLAIMDVSERDS